MLLDPSQEAAVDLICSAPIGIVTGSPGTGKTTSLRAALDRMDARGVRYLLAASTGKAAMRMRDLTERPTQTVHRLLGFGRGSDGEGFIHHAKCPLEADVVIVDEFSMCDVEIVLALFDAVQAPTRLIALGDMHQLPSVGPGAVLRDLIASERVPVARLTTLHRAAAESWVATQAQVILAGKSPSLAARHDFEWLECNEREAAADALVLATTTTLPARGVAQADIQPITPMNVGPCGASALNRRLQAALHGETPRAGGWKVGGKDEGQALYVGDRVIQTKNDYLLGPDGVFNGEIGIVDGVDDDEGLFVRFPDKAVRYNREAARALRLAYALTGHRFQGSETPWCVVLCHSTHTRMLGRSWLYTAITRAKKGVVLVGDRLGLERAIKNASDSKRNTTLAARVRGEELDA